MCQLNRHYQNIFVWEVNSFDIVLSATNDDPRFGVGCLNLGYCYSLLDHPFLGVVCGAKYSDLAKMLLILMVLVDSFASMSAFLLGYVADLSRYLSHVLPSCTSFFR